MTAAEGHVDEGGDTASSTPRVSVVVPTYNRADLIAETLRSVAAQTLREWECLVVDDGSTDDTRAVVESFAQGDRRFRYVWQTNASAAAARNHGLRLARAPLVAFLDSDDLFEPDKLEWQVEALETDSEAVLAYGQTLMFRHDRPEESALYLPDVPDKPQGWAFEALLACSAIYAPVVRAAALRAVGGFDESLPSAEDWDAWLSLARQGKLVFSDRVALRYRVHSGNKSSHLLRNYRCGCRVAEKHLRAFTANPMRRARLRRRVRAYFRRVYTPRMLQAAHAAGMADQWSEARALWRALIRLNPGAVFEAGAPPNVAWALLPTERPPVWRNRPALRGCGETHV